MNFLGLNIKNTRYWSRWWENRKIDWDQSYLKTWNHPHRFIITSLLGTFDWYSLYEVGCGAGANLVNILKFLPNKQLGGSDINPDAIELCKKTFKGGLFKVENAGDIGMSDKSVDVILSDMVYIYVDNFSINKYIRELRRVARKEIVLCEFYEKNPIKRIFLYFKTKYHFHDWLKILKKNGFYDITMIKLPASAWPGGLQEKYCYLIKAKSPKRYV